MSENSKASKKEQAAPENQAEGPEVLTDSAILGKIFADLQSASSSGNLKNFIEKLLDWVEELHCNWKYERARKILDKCNSNQVTSMLELDENKELKRRFGQKHALSTYKDRSLHAERLDEALKILKKIDNLSETKDQEILSLAGHIYQRKWELTGQERYLEMSFAYYEACYGQDENPAETLRAGVNAAFVLDLLADLESPDSKDLPRGYSGDTASKRRKKAEGIREKMVNTFLAVPFNVDVEEQTLPPELVNRWRNLVKGGEAYLGLEKYPEAKKWLLQAAALRKNAKDQGKEISECEIESG